MDPYPINYEGSSSYRQPQNSSYGESANSTLGRSGPVTHNSLTQPYGERYSKNGSEAVHNHLGSLKSNARVVLSNLYGSSMDTYSTWSSGDLSDRSLGKPGRPWEHANERGKTMISPRDAQTQFRQGGQQQSQRQQSIGVFPSSGPTAKRGSRACLSCRKGKNRCEWDPSGKATSCRRCLLNGITCVYEKPAEKPNARGRKESVTEFEFSGEAVNRISTLEKTVENLSQGQNQIHDTLQQLLALFPKSRALSTPKASLPTFGPSNASSSGVPPSTIFNSVSPPQVFSNASLADISQHQFETPHSPQNTASGRVHSQSTANRNHLRRKEFPALPGFAPPNHRFGTYGIIPLPSTAPSPSRSQASSRSSSSSRSQDKYSSALPHETLTAPIQALQALANAADQAAALVGRNSAEENTEAGRGSDGVEVDKTLNVNNHGNEKSIAQQKRHDEDRGRSRKRKRVTIDGKSIQLRVWEKTRLDPIPRNPFPDVVTKGLVSEEEARELWDIFFSGCHYFVPLFDKSYDTFETFIERTPFSTNSLLAVAAKIRAGNGPLGETFHRCLEEAQGIARSTLFGPIVRKEAVMAMLILSLWSQNGWLPCGHALRMGLDMNLHRALDKLANKDENRTENEERDLVVSARIWMNCYMHEHLVSLGTGKPLMLRDDQSVQQARKLLDHPMASETDMHLIAGVELVNLRISIIEHLNPLHGKLDTSTITFVKSKLAEIQAWYQEWYNIHKSRYDEESVLVKLLETERVYAEMWTVCVALRGCTWDKLSQEQKDLAFHAKDSAWRCMEIFLHSQNFRRHLKYATHDQLVSVAFAAVFLLKIAILYPTSLSISILILQVSQLAQLLSSECFAERYALILRLMLSSFRRTTGAASTMPGTPRPGSSAGTGTNHGNAAFSMPSLMPSGPINDLNRGLQSFLELPSMENGMEIDGSGNREYGDVATGMTTMTEGSTGLWELPGLTDFDWPTELSPSVLPLWLRDGSATDLGLPADGSDSLFLPLE
ncbi:hypothetical protein L204_100670 [Cryptococcus depauperatus]